MKIPAIFKDYDYLYDTLKVLDESLPNFGNKDLPLQILAELFLRPYLPSRELCDKCEINEEDVRNLYSFLRSSREAVDLFEFSPYHYLAWVLEHLSKDAERTSSIIRGETPSPLSETMELFISETCNAKCKFCYREGKTYDERRALSTQEYVSLINEFADLHGRNLDVSGGLEPLLGQSILDVLQTGLRRDLKVSLYTNGIALNSPDVIDCLMKTNRVRVSLTAYDRKSYKEVMGVDKFDVVIDNLRNLVKAKKDYHSNVRIGTSFVVFRENYKHVSEAIKLARELDVDFFDLRSVEVTDLGDFHEEQRKELGSILRQIRQNKYSRMYDGLSVSVADTFNVIVDTNDDSSKYLKEEFVNALSSFRVTVTPHGKVYALNLNGQPSREDQRYLMGEINGHNSLSDMLTHRKPVPFDRKSLLAHDLTLMTALSKLASDMEFGISPEENPFNWR
jgi:MoaA/NifB/PqqE/SkfB family radical SAM enzyme